MTPIGHSGVALLLGCPLARAVSIGAAVVGALAPDIDFLLIGFPWFNAIHRVWTHNLFFVVLVAGLGAALTRGSSRAPVVLGLLLGGALHLAVDACFDGNPTNGVGVALFWPASTAMVSPFNLAATADAVGWDQPLRGLAHAARLSWWEPFLLVVGALSCRSVRAGLRLGRPGGQPGRQK